MPTSPAYPCRAPGCPQLQPCPTHPRESLIVRPNVDVRRWYHLARWRHPVWGRRAQVLARDPLCVECLKAGRVVPTTDVDHVVPHRGDPVLFWDPLNLQGLCHGCHSRKTRSEEP
jgi:5-methylcytosine-specific restriction enzyme A